MKIPDERLVQDQALVKGIWGEGRGTYTIRGKDQATANPWDSSYGSNTVQRLSGSEVIPISNTILRRPVLYNFEMTTGIRYLCMKFPIEGGVASMNGRQDEYRAMYLVTLIKEEEDHEVQPKVMEVRGEEKEQRTEATGKLENFP